MFRPRVEVHRTCPRRSSISEGTMRAKNSGSATEQQELISYRRYRKYLGIFVKIWGIITAVVLGGVGTDLVYHKHHIGYYELGGAVFILFLELLWVVTAFLLLCVRSDHCVWRWWSKVLWLEGWKKSLLYGPMGAVPLIWPQRLWLSYVASAQLIFLAFIHFLMSFKCRRRRKKRTQLLNGEIDSIESKFEEVANTIMDIIPEPIPGSSLSLADSLTGHETVVEI